MGGASSDVAGTMKTLAVKLHPRSLPRATNVAVLAATLLAATATQAQVSLPYYDGFNYAEGVLNTVGGPTWFAGSSGVEISVTNPASLTAPPGFPAATGKGVRKATTGTRAGTTAIKSPNKKSRVRMTCIPGVYRT